MRVVIQRSKKAEVAISGTVVGEISKGLVLLVGINEEDTQEDVDYLVGKITKMRIFEDENEKMNLAITDVAGAILSISQFTLFADTKKGNRPSFIKAARPEQAIPLYEAFNQGLKEAGITVATGEFGADMQVSLINDGPVTIIIDSQSK
ncbi:D-aminoacyl-tRNA deacylase [Carnobacterium divergens]|uniref:D-aminoacyl-tRNA deacylase n=1 Tax=Carnobacterium divergens TaxID=2748 RepID=A0A7Z8G3G8_CARDV|nr:D-aminoacyl-tRNA deacylase [Carnobacterium divergens]TFI71296.1 D-tyrosyl-tRNA(Tyr) deacylase [Carnobacterium divergens]TFI75938.1 D-tyrosyl-tRNA(Tyr) deacylase [Carnobacterium divergens]TFI81810.1 D-tyrosyl-tRNA(Tyr) deacylase [Carnobacterium divergens]TFI94119.1 D-tyrosyl-tRNA(Tyr) deacylase [Carnobacterium divergens]TFJ10399.1 D-tyrosyl-tRNA(Tyr) deacylase [Carnobacterium divergens]